MFNFYDIAGEAAKFRAESADLCNKGEALIALQRRQHARGVTKAELVLSIYGWTLRHASGLNGFSLIRTLGTNDVNAALDVAFEWVGDSKLRSVFVRATTAQRCLEKHGEDILSALLDRGGSIGGW